MLQRFSPFSILSNYTVTVIENNSTIKYETILVWKDRKRKIDAIFIDVLTCLYTTICDMKCQISYTINNILKISKRRMSYKLHESQGFRVVYNSINRQSVKIALFVTTSSRFFVISLTNFILEIIDFTEDIISNFRGA